MSERWLTPRGMSRRHFLRHMAASSALVGTASQFAFTMRAHSQDLKKRHKAVILLWMGGGPSTLDIWDLKPGSAAGGPFKPISTSGDVEICEHLPQMAEQMHHLAVVRSMSTREADHDRGRYYMHTGFVPNPDVTHPSYGAVVSHELAGHTDDLEIPPFVSIGGPSEGPGFLGMAYAPFVVGSDGRVRDLDSKIEQQRLMERKYVLKAIEDGFINERRGQLASDHKKVLDKTFSLMTSDQMKAFKYADEPAAVKDRYGDTQFGRGCLMARRLIETGVSFVEVDYGGWDNHRDVFNILQNDKLPTVDQAMSALIEDLDQRGLLADTVIVWMGEFGRTPRINGDTGRDHWARSWSAVVGGGGINGGIAVGKTNDDGTTVETEPYSSEDLMASVLHAVGIPLDKTYTANNGRPMKIGGGGRLIPELFA